MRRAAYRPLTAGKHAKGGMEFGILGPWRCSKAASRCRCRGRGSAACSRCSSFMRTRLSRLTGSSTSSGHTRIRSRDPRRSRRRRLAAAQGARWRLRAHWPPCAPGYVVRVGPEQLDLHRFEALVAGAAERIRRRLQMRSATHSLSGAGLRSRSSRERFAETAIGRLDELRLLALEKRIDADLALGRHRDLVPELETLVSQHPLREGLRAQLDGPLPGGPPGRCPRGYSRQRAARSSSSSASSQGLRSMSSRRPILRHDPALDLAVAGRATSLDPRRRRRCCGARPAAGGGRAACPKAGERGDRPTAARAATNSHGYSGDHDPVRAPCRQGDRPIGSLHQRDAWGGRRATRDRAGRRSHRRRCNVGAAR